MAIVLPYTRKIGEIDPLAPGQIDDLLRSCIEFSKENPCYIEVADGDAQRCLFFRERQIYAAGKILNQQFGETTIQEFFVGCSEMNAPRLTCYEVNDKILHSLLIIFQKKPAINIQSSLVDLDKLLDTIEDEGRSCIVGAVQDDFFAVLRYEKGAVTALCHRHSLPSPREASCREDFLVAIYTLPAERPLFISLYDDLLVRYAGDAKVIDDSCRGSISDLFLAKPPAVVIKLKDKEVNRLVLDRPVVKIGRMPDNDICIDNLAVSRVHAIIEQHKGTFYIKDCDSLNGTLLNGARIGCARLQDRDVVRIGKHEIIFLKQEGKTVPGNTLSEGLDQTVVITRGAGDGNAPARAATAGEPQAAAAEEPSNESPGGDDRRDSHCPRLVEKTPDGERVTELLKPALILGNDESADISIRGFLVAARHAEIVRDGDHFVIRHLKGLRRVRVGGKSVSESILKPNDTIEIANREFVFIG